MEKYLVTGAAGHLGLNVIKELVKRGKSVRALVLENDKNAINIPKGVEICYGNITNPSELERFFENRNEEELIVIHCAGIVSIASKYNQAVHDVNVEGTKNLIDLSKKNDVKKFIYVSSVHAIKEVENHGLITETRNFSSENVVGLYAKTKAEATSHVLNAASEGFPATIVHPSGIIGPDDYGNGHTKQLIIDYCNGGLTAAVNGGYDFVDVRDVTKGIISSVAKGRNNECYILSNKYFEIKTILDMLSKIADRKKIRTYLPLWFAKTTALAAETYYRVLKQAPLFTRYSLYTLESNSNFSHEKATKELNYNPRPMEETLEDTVNFLKMIKKIK